MSVREDYLQRWEVSVGVEFHLIIVERGRSEEIPEKGRKRYNDTKIATNLLNVASQRTLEGSGCIWIWQSDGNFNLESRHNFIRMLRLVDDDETLDS
jgi:hypothetical protein